MKKINKKAKFNYILLEKYEAGISLVGAEVKAIRGGHIDLSNAYAKVIENQMFLVNADIPVSGKKEYSSTRSRKLLMHKSEIVSLRTKIKAKKLTLVPTAVYTKARLIKVEIALAKPKRKFEKKESLKKKDVERDIERQLRGDKTKHEIRNSKH